MNYKLIYDSLISSRLEVKNKRLAEKRDGRYFEGHHIIPTCLGGKGGYKRYSHPNLVLLTLKEHAFAHRLLTLIHPGNYKLLYAYNMMIGVLKFPTNMNKKGLKVPAGLTMKGKIHREASKKQTSETLKAYYRNNKDIALIYQKGVCTHCGYVNKKNIISRYHNHNCKRKSEMCKAISAAIH